MDDVKMEVLLERALQNEKNAKYLKMNVATLKKNKAAILKDLRLSHKDHARLVAQLSNYIFVEDVGDLSYGSCIRWISVMDLATEEEASAKHPKPKEKPNENQSKPFKLHKPILFCELKITDGGMMMLCKSFSNRLFYLKLDECLVFQKLNNQERIILAAMQTVEGGGGGRGAASSSSR